MRITCPSCSTSYTIPDDKIGSKGRQVKCASCGTLWQVSLTDAAAFAPVDIDDLFAEDAGRMAEAAAPVASPRLPAAATASEDPDGIEAVSAPMPEASGDETVEGFGEIVAPVAGEVKKTDIESLAKKPKIKAKKGKPAKVRRRPPFDVERFLVRARPVFGAATLVLAIGVIAGILVLRTPITAAFPALASMYAMVGLPVNLRGLDIGHLQMMREVENAQPVLVVEGELSNPTASEQSVPAIRFALRGDDSQEIYAWSIEPRQSMLTPGATMRFRTRLASPPEQAADIQVRMIDRRNQQVALHE